MRTTLRLVLAAMLLLPLGALSTSVIAQQSTSGLDSARYVWRDVRGRGGYLILYFQIKGNTVVRTTQESAGGGPSEPRTDIHQIRNGEFDWSREPSECLVIYSSPDCGIRGTIREDAIHFTATMNGRPTSNQWARGPMEVARRQR